MARRAARLLTALAVLAAPAAAQLRPVEVGIAGRAGVDSLVRLGFEVAGVRLVAGRLRATIVASPETEGRLAAGGFTPAPVALTPDATVAAADTYRVFRSFERPGDGIRATLEAWAAADPARVHLDSIGASVEGRPILVVKVGDAADSPARPNVLFLATHHAREWVSTEVAMRLVRWVADSLDPALAASRDVWVIPVQNPDGYQYSFTAERFWRKNRRPNADGTFGVDPNRNYPAFWGRDNLGSSPDPWSEVYRGPGPASEPETRAVVAFHAAHPPVLAVSYHTYSGLILHPYGFAAGAVAPDAGVYGALAGTDLAPAVRDRVPFSSLAYYHPGPSWNLYAVNGEYTDWAYRAHGTIAFTPELTSGCCASGGGYYGFAFPDDSAMVAQVFSDNLPFALSVIAAAGDVATARGASGLVAPPPRIESVWPEAWVALPTGAAPAPTLAVRTGAGGLAARGLRRDSLDAGRTRERWRADLRADTISAVRVEAFGLAAELVTLAGAEDLDVGWSGWQRSSDRVAGAWSWISAGDDTLVSPVADLRGRRAVWLHVWTKHSGSTFTPERHGVVQLSTDSGATWADAAVFVGDGPAWYPARVDLPAAAGAPGVRVRFVSEGFPWWIDAVGFATDSALGFRALPVAGGAELSENPVRGDQVVIAWPVGTGAARVGIYTFAGHRLVAASVAAGLNEYVWNLTVGGRRVPNGAYLLVVEVDGRRYRRRLFVARGP